MDSEHVPHPSERLDALGVDAAGPTLHLPRSGAPVLLLAGHGRRPRGLPAPLLWEAGLGTLQLDSEPDDDLAALVARFRTATRRLRELPRTAQARLGYVGGGTAGTAALLAAAQDPGQVTAVATLSAPLEPAADWLPRVEAPTLLVVGGRDVASLRSARECRARLGGGSRLDVVAGAGAGFEEEGALELAGLLVAAWAAAWLRPSQARLPAA